MSWLPVPRKPETVQVSITLDVARREEHQRRVGRTVREQPRRTILDDHAAAHQPGAVLGAAGERPASAHAVAAGGRHGLASRRVHAAGDGARVAVDLGGGRRRQIAGEEATRRADHRAPSRRTVGLSQGFEHAQENPRLDLTAADRARHAHAEDAGVGHLADEIEGHAPAAFGLVGTRAQRRRQPARSLQQRVLVGADCRLAHGISATRIATG
jgi:hypothetical protein